MNKNRLLYVLVLSLPFIMGPVAPTPDSANTTTANTRPGTITPYYPGQSMIGGSNGINDSFNPNAVYPPCPGDPSNPSTGISSPMCPDINGIWPQNIAYLINLLANYTYNVANGTYTFAQLLCPDICITTRASSPAPPSNITSPYPVTSFQTASCPAGYDVIAQFNPQPAIVNITAPQQLYGPFSSQAALNVYKNNPAYSCSIQYLAYDTVFSISGSPFYGSPPNVPGINSSIIVGPVDNGVIPNTNGKHLILTGNASYGTSNPYCSTSNANPTYAASDSPPPYGTDMLINGNIGQYIPDWTYTPFNNNPTQSNIAADYGSYSFNIADTTCTGLATWSGTFHKDIYYHYYRWEYCRPATITGWYYTSSYIPASLVCARRKPAWQTAN